MDRLTTLQAFVRLVEVGSFSAVAEELRVKQSTVSKWIAALEDELGARLVDRTTRAQHPTEAGEQFYRRAKDIVAAYAEATAELAPSTSLTGRLRVSVPVVYGTRHVVPLVAAFMRKHPRLELELTFSDRYINLVDEGVDLAVRVGTPMDSSFRATTVARARRHLVASKRYLQTAMPLERPDDLSHHGCLLHTGLRNQATWTFRRASRSYRANVRGRLSANNSEALLVLAKAGMGVALLASWLVERELSAGRLVDLLPEYQAPDAPVQLLMPPGKTTHPRVRALILHLKQGLGSDSE